MASDYNELARRLFAALISHRLGISQERAYVRYTPARMPVFWVMFAESLDRRLSDVLAAAILPDEVCTKEHLEKLVPASPRKQ